MASNSVFPGVYVTIVDNSFYTEGIVGVIGFMCIFAKRGPDNRPILVTSATDLVNMFGYPSLNKYGQGWYIAKQYVDIFSNLWLERVLPNDAIYSTYALQLGSSDSEETYTSSYNEITTKITYNSEDGTATKVVTTVPYTVDTTTGNETEGDPTEETTEYTAEEAAEAGIVASSTRTTTEETETAKKTVDAVVLEGVNAVSVMDTYLADGGYNGIDADVIFYPVGRGAWYDRISIKLTPSTRNYANAYKLDIYELNDDNDATVPSLVESFTVTFDEDSQDSSGDSLYIVNVLERYSEWVRCKVSDKVGNYETALTYDFSSSFESTQNLVGGSDGTMYDNYGNLDWDKVSDEMVNAYNGLNVNPETGDTNELILDTEDMDFSVVFDAGYPSVVKDAIVDLCESRESCFAFLDNGDNAKASAAVTARQSDNNYTTYRAALYEPYTKVYDSFNGVYIWISPIYHVVNAFCKTARDKNLWWPFAGLQRGGCDGIEEFRYKLAGGYKDTFKENEINPIMHFASNGDVIFGNWTTQSTASALKNIHVVLCLQYIYRTLQQNLKKYIFELNDSFTWDLISDNVSSFLSEIMSERALEYFTVDVSATDYEKRNNKCHVTINLRVTGTIEIINCTLNVE